jgi:hypothetical protein
MTTNLWTVGQGIVTRRLREQIQPVQAKRSSRTPPKVAEPTADTAVAAEPKEQKPAPPRRVKRKKKRARR